MTVAVHLTLNELWRGGKKAEDPIEKGRSGRLPRQTGPHRQGDRQDHPQHPRQVQETAHRYNLKLLTQEMAQATTWVRTAWFTVVHGI